MRIFPIIMCICETLKAFLLRHKKNNDFSEDSDTPGSHSASVSEYQSRILDIERSERAKEAELLRRIQKLYVSQETRRNTIWKRLGFPVQHDTHHSPQPSASSRGRPESSIRGRRIRTRLEEDNRDRTPKTDQKLDKEDPFFEKKLRLGSQLAILSCHVAKMTATDRSPSPDSESLSSIDTHTPSELRAIPYIMTPSPTPAIRRPSRLPVMSARPGGAVKEVADGCKLQTHKQKMKEIEEQVDKCLLIHHPSTAGSRKTLAGTQKVPAPPSTAAPPNRKGPRRGTLAVTQKVPAPPSAPAPTKRKGPRRGTLAVTQKVPAPPSAPAPTNRREPQCGPPEVTPKVPAHPSAPALPNQRGPRRGTTLRTTTTKDLQPLKNPKESLPLCFQQISSDDWEKKTEGLKSIEALAKHHPGLLQTKLHEVCLVVTEEVNNLRSAVACAAIDSVAQLHVQFGRTMDPEAERTGRTLLLKLAQTNNAFIQQQVNLALDALVEGCSPGRVISALLNIGLSHRCVAVRESTALHLLQLAHTVGEENILTAGKTFAERFLIAVSTMAVDAAPAVRHHGQEMLHGLACQKEFMVLSGRVVPEENRRPLQKILQKMRDQDRRRN